MHDQSATGGGVTNLQRRVSYNARHFLHDQLRLARDFDERFRSPRRLPQERKALLVLARPERLACVIDLRRELRHQVLQLLPRRARRCGQPPRQLVQPLRGGEEQPEHVNAVAEHVHRAVEDVQRPGERAAHAAAAGQGRPERENHAPDLDDARALVLLVFGCLEPLQRVVQRPLECSQAVLVDKELLLLLPRVV